jgi:hypothetical protein
MKQRSGRQRGDNLTILDLSPSAASCETYDTPTSEVSRRY